MAPELILDDLDCSKPVDVWSVGILMAQLLNKMKHPFVEKTDSEEKIKEMILNGKTGIDKIDCNAKAKHLLKKLLEIKPSDRYTVDEALAHPWITGKEFSD